MDLPFTVDGPDRLWVADITYVPTGAGFLSLAVVLDAWSRRVIGWAMATHLRTALVLAALDMALGQRRPQGVIHHSDHGCQYTAIAYGQRCLAFGVRPSAPATLTQPSLDNTKSITVMPTSSHRRRRGPGIGAIFDRVMRPRPSSLGRAGRSAARRARARERLNG